MGQKRLLWLDIARGITIILMVVGHSSIPNSLFKYIFSFHMPFFFFISGLLWKPLRYKSFKDFAIKKIKTLFIPYVFFSSIVFCGYIGTEYFHPEELYLGWRGYALWFVPVLFLAEFSFYLLQKIHCKTILFFTILSITLFGYCLSVFEIHLPFKIESIPFALFFVGMGFLLKDQFLEMPKKNSLIIFSGIFSFLFSQLLPRLRMGANIFGILIPNLLNALLGIFFVFQISKLLSEIPKSPIIRFLSWFGANSLYVMAFSQLYNYWILTLFNKTSLPSIVSFGLRYVFLFCFIFLSASFCKKYLPYCVGVQTKNM